MIPAILALKVKEVVFHMWGIGWQESVKFVWASHQPAGTFSACGAQLVRCGFPQMTDSMRLQVCSLRNTFESCIYFTWSTIFVFVFLFSLQEKFSKKKMLRKVDGCIQTFLQHLILGLNRGFNFKILKNDKGSF